MDFNVLFFLIVFVPSLNLLILEKLHDFMLMVIFIGFRASMERCPNRAIIRIRYVNFRSIVSMIAYEF